MWKKWACVSEFMTNEQDNQSQTFGVHSLFQGCLLGNPNCSLVFYTGGGCCSDRSYYISMGILSGPVCGTPRPQSVPVWNQLGFAFNSLSIPTLINSFTVNSITKPSQQSAWCKFMAEGPQIKYLQRKGRRWSQNKWTPAVICAAQTCR